MSPSGLPDAAPKFGQDTGFHLNLQGYGKDVG
jgi:hypothetical protein